jgi:hypothetical protein
MPIFIFEGSAKSRVSEKSRFNFPPSKFMNPVNSCYPNTICGSMTQK